MHETDRLSFFLYARWHDFRNPIRPTTSDFIIPRTSSGHRRNAPIWLELVSTLAMPFLSACSHWRNSRQRYSAIRQLNRLSDHQLADIGLERNQIRGAVDGILAGPAQGTLQARRGKSAGAQRRASAQGAAAACEPAVKTPQDAIA